MDRRYRPLRPFEHAAESASDTQEDSTLAHPNPSHESPGLKKRRTSVAIACNECRRKKIRCDGQRPTCSMCIGTRSQCDYRDGTALSFESRRLITEIIRILRRLPTMETVRVLKELGDSDALTIITTLRARAQALPSTSASEDADEAAALAVGESPDSESDFVELELHNPVAYPVISSVSRAESDQFEAGSHEASSHSSEYGTAATSLSRLHSISPSLPGTTPDRYATNEPLLSLTPRAHEQRRQEPKQLCDSRLRNLRISRWTDVEIDDALAARCISLYLETDHPLLGYFDSDLFISDLVPPQQGARDDRQRAYQHCSPLLVNALLYWACVQQMYSAIDARVGSVAIDFCAEAERLWKQEREEEGSFDSLLNVVAAEFLCLGYLCQGRNHMVLTYLNEATSMGSRMGLFGGENSGLATDASVVETDTLDDANSGRESQRARMFAAWGLFNFATLMSLFYRQPGISIPFSPPSLPIPRLSPSASSTDYMGQTFHHLCRFWSIVHEVSLEYHGSGHPPWASGATLRFAEFKFRELLAWSNSLPSPLSSEHSNRPHHVKIMHLWFHAAILDIFRPFVYDSADRDRRLRTFAGDSITPQVVYDGSTTRLKRLILDYRKHYISSTYTILWHTALLYAANAILESTEIEQKKWYPYIMLILYGYVRLSGTWRVAKAVSKGLLSMIVGRGDMSSEVAWRIMGDLDSDDLDGGDLEETTEEIRATFMLDLRKAVDDPDTSTVEKLAEDFEGNAMMMEYTNIMN